MASDELKKCPFCGGEGHTTDIGDFTPEQWQFTGMIVEVKCDNCFAKLSGYKRDQRENTYEVMLDRAIQAWNRRTP